MKVKRFFAPDMRQAMRRVREEIGPDAVIVSNHRVAGGVEVVAAHENDYESAQQEFSRQHEQDKQRKDLEQKRKEQIDILTGGGQSRNLAEELQKARMKIAEAQQTGQNFDAPAKGNRQFEQQSEEDLRAILESLKQRQKKKAGTAPYNFGQNAQGKETAKAHGKFMEGFHFREEAVRQPQN